MFGSFFGTDPNPQMPKRIGLLGAMPEETKLVDRAISVDSSTEVAGREYVSGLLEGFPVTAAFTRWGKVAAAITTTTMIEKFGCDLVVFTGVAGAADPALNVGDVVVGQNLYQHDMDVSPLPNFAKFEIPFLDVVSLSSLPRVTNFALEGAQHFLAHELADKVPGEYRREFGILEPKAVLGSIASGDQFVADVAKVAALRQEIPDLQAIEMEGAAMAQVAHEHGVPFVVMRTISDRADHTAHLDFPRFCQEVASRMSLGLVRSFLLQYKSFLEESKS